MAIIDRRGVSVDSTDTAIAGDPNPGLAIKAPVRAATTAAITLSGLQTIDGVALASGDRVLVKDQADQRTNGIYNASSGLWQRTVDADSNDQWAAGLVVVANSGTQNVDVVFVLTSADPVDLGVSNVVFVAQPIAPAQLPNPTATTLGGVKSLAAVSHQFLTSIGTDGGPTQAQPDVSDISGGAALSKVDDTNVTMTLGGTPLSALLKAVSLTLGWVGKLGLSRGGTNADLSATGGTGQYLKQSSTGAAITVGTIPAADLPGTISGFADPSASIGLAAVNGAATTAMRSDAAPALSQTITPTWTNLHTFNAGVSVGAYGFFNGGHLHYTDESGAPQTATNQGPMMVESGGPQYTWHETDQSAPITGTAQAGSATTITLAVGSAAVDNFSRYVPSTITITGGTGSGQTRLIASYVGATKVATISGSNFSPAPDNTSTYSIGRVDYGWWRSISDDNCIFNEVWESSAPLTGSDGPFGQQDEWLRFNRWIHVASMNYPLTGNGNRDWYLAANYVWDAHGIGGEPTQTARTLSLKTLNAAAYTLIDALVVTPGNATPTVSVPTTVNWVAGLVETCTAKKTGSVTMTENNVAQAFALASEDFDTSGAHDNVTNNSRLTAMQGGTYLVTANANLTMSGTYNGTVQDFNIRKNGTTNVCAQQREVGVGASTQCSGGMSTIVALAPADYVEFTVNLNATAGTGATVNFADLSFVRVGA